MDNQNNNLNNSTTSVTNNVNSNLNETNNVNVTEQQTTSLPVTEVRTSPTGIEFNDQKNNVNQDGCFKSVLAFVFLIAVIVFVIFLPDISEYIESKRKPAAQRQIENRKVNGTLVCAKNSSTKDIDTDYEIKMIFKNQKLISSRFTTIVESYDTPVMLDKKTKCDEAVKIAETTNGLDMQCNLEDTVLTVVEEYELKNIKRDDLKSYINASGTDPKYDYGENIYNIKQALEKEKYNCEVSDIVQE